MLEFFRQHLGGGLLGLVLVGLLAAAFAFSFGAQSKGWGEGQSEQIAAAAAGYDISDNTLEYAFNLMGGRGLDRDDAEGASLKTAALDGLIERSLLLDLASDLGITASTDEAVENIIHGRLMLTRSVASLMERIEAYPFFDPKDASDVVVSAGHRIPQSFKNDEGEFNMDFYKNFVQNHLRQTEDDFIEQQRLEIVAERMRRLLVGGVRISDDEARLEYERDSDTASIKYIRVMPAYFSDKMKPTPEELTTWIEAHKEDIKKKYESNQYKYTDLEEQVRARHILIRVTDDAKPEEKAAAKAKIDAALARAKNGEDFAALATELSDDTASAAKGGDLGYTPRGRMVPEFDKVMFDTKTGEISDVIETKYGYHILKVEGVRKGNVSLEEATPEIADEMYRDEKAKAEAKAAADGYLARIQAGEAMETVVPPESPDNKGPFSIKVQSSRPFAKTAKTIPGIGPSDDIIKAAFEDSKEAKIYTVNGDFFVVENGERNKPNDEEFAKQKDDIKEKLLSMKQSLLLSTQIKTLRDKAVSEGKVKILYQPAKVSAKDETDVPKSDAEKKDGKGKKGKEKNKSKSKEKSEGKTDVEKKASPKSSAPSGDGDESNKGEADEPEGE